MGYRLPENWTGRAADFDGVVHAARTMDPVENHSHALMAACRDAHFDVATYVAPWPVTCLWCWTAFAKGD